MNHGSTSVMSRGIDYVQRRKKYWHATLYGGRRCGWVVTTGQRTHTHAHGNACVVWVEGRGSKIPHGKMF